MQRLACGFAEDLSPAGETAGICGVHSGLIVEMLHLIGGKAEKSEVARVGEVPFMPLLDQGAAVMLLSERLEEHGCRWVLRFC